MALKATKEGPRKILITSSRCHNISVRDAISGLLLRTIEVPDKLTIYSILLDGGQLYCGTNKNLVFRYEFTVCRMPEHQNKLQKKMFFFFLEI